MDKNHNDEILSDLSEIRRSLKRTERNVAFLAWFAIAGIVMYGLTLIIALGSFNSLSDSSSKLDSFKSSSSSSSSTSTSSSTSNSGVYTPKDYAVLATSEECYESVMATASSGDRAAFNILLLDGCIVIYDSSKMNFKLGLLKTGGFGEPDVYYKIGSPSEKYWASMDAFK